MPGKHTLTEAFASATQGPSGEVPYRPDMEAAFGQDFGAVRAHVGQADAMQDLGASAAASGEVVAFGSGSPDRELVAHELTHVVQTRQSGAPSSGVSAPGDPSEREADQVGAAVARGEPAQVRERASAGLHGNWFSDTIGDLTNTRPGEAALDASEDRSAAQRALHKFMAKQYGEERFRPGTGIGMFDAAYNPMLGALGITLKVHFNFQSGGLMWSGREGRSVGDMLREVTWTEPEKKAWRQKAIADVKAAWSQRYSFHTTHPDWEALPTVNVKLDVLEAEAKDAHFVVDVHKWPDEGQGSDFIRRPGLRGRGRSELHEHPGDELDFHYYSDTERDDLDKRLADANPSPITFAQHSEVLGAEEEAAVQEFGAELASPGMSAPKIKVKGYYQAGDEGEKSNLGLERARAVAHELERSGAKAPPDVLDGGKATDVEGLRVEIEIDLGYSGQHTVRHEFGHMLGFGDEYTDPEKGRTRDTEVEHSELAQELIPGQAPIKARDDDSIMAQGEEFRPYHYVTFLEVLGKMTGMQEWAIGPGPTSR